MEKLHKVGYIHRDVKPGNFLLPHGNKKDRIYMIDFGLCKKIKSKSVFKDENEEERERQFVGTKKFASVASHRG